MVSDAPDDHADYGEDVQFGNAASDYSTYRATYPEELFERLADRGIGSEEQRLLDIGTGTGFLANELAARGSLVTGLDVDRDLLAAARADTPANADGHARYAQAAAEHLPVTDSSVDVAVAGQCWHWFDRATAARELRRVLVPGGQVVITHFDWLPREGNVVAATEDLILEYSPDWPAAGGNGFYPDWPSDLYGAGFEDVETFSFDVDVAYTHEAWRGRIRASAGVGGSLPPAEVTAFDEDLTALLAEDFPDEPLAVPHRSFTVVGTAPKQRQRT